MKKILSQSKKYLTDSGLLKVFPLWDFFALLQYTKGIIELNDKIQDKASDIENLGFNSLDALHIASAVSEKVDAMLTTDDKLEKNGRKMRRN